MKNFILFCFSLLTLLSCNETPKSTPVTSNPVSNSTATPAMDLVNQLAAFYSGTSSIIYNSSLH